MSTAATAAGNASLEPTYEGLKQKSTPGTLSVVGRLEPTYEGLKQLAQESSPFTLSRFGAYL